MNKAKDVRKVRFTPTQIKDLLIALESYLDQTQFPTLAEFVVLPDIRHKYKLTTQYVYDHPEIFEHLLSVMTSKCEAYLVKRGLAGQAIPMTIFMLKQRKYGGYSDSQQLDLTSQSQPIKFVNAVPRPTDRKKRAAK